MRLDLEHVHELGFDWWTAAGFAFIFGWLVVLGIASQLSEKGEQKRRQELSLEIQRRQHEHEKRMKQLAQGTDDWGWDDE